MRIGELLTLRVERDQHSCADVKLISEQKLERIDNKINELKRIRKALYKITDACCGGVEPATPCTILNALDVGLDDSHLLDRNQEGSSGGKHHA